MAKRIAVAIPKRMWKMWSSQILSSKESPISSFRATMACFR
jgi:hypothetical protein